ncbi:hypothetical protein KFU94_63700 [Chloroflexi bacterium TSY]|nr:hypothetical protein [Chloroflexi bacterium TSY]
MAENPNTQMAMTEEEALKLVAYLTASADISLFEPELYGPFRLIDAASQVADAVLSHNPSKERRAFWEAFKREIDEKKGWLMWDRPGFRAFLQEMPANVAAEMTRTKARDHD